MRELTELKRSGGLVEGLLAEHGLFHLDADLRWIEVTAARLDALARVVRPRGPARAARGERRPPPGSQRPGGQGCAASTKSISATNRTPAGSCWPAGRNSRTSESFTPKTASLSR